MSFDTGRTEVPELLQLFRLRRFPELAERSRELLAQHPGQPGLWKALGVALEAMGELDQALEAKQRAVDLDPDDPESRANLANALMRTGAYAEAALHFESATRLQPQQVQPWRLRARALVACGHAALAVDCQKRAVDLMPDSLALINELGNLHRDLHQLPEAERCFRRMLELQSRSVEAACNLGNTMRDMGRMEDAEAWYRRAIEWSPPLASLYSNLGNLLMDTGRFREAQEAYRHAVVLEPTLLPARTNLLLSMNYAGAPAAEALLEAREFGRIAMEQARGPLSAPPRRPRQGPLRVGMMSGDFRQHPVGYFLEGWLPHVDRSRIQVFGYPTDSAEDLLTARLKPHFARWHRLRSLTDEAAARQIAEDNLDVLIDLSGHTAYNRLGLMAWKPARVQVSWLGYFATTGLPTVNWLVADKVSLPPALDHHFTERIWRLPHTRLCFAPPDRAPPVAPLPCIANGYVTFGSFQNFAKVTDEVVRTWCEVLRKVPGSRLRLQSPQIGDPRWQDVAAARFAAHGIGRERLSLHGKVARDEYLAAHANVDVILDTFPFPGGTTTCEALWMGVPTVTLEGDRMISRQGAALLSAAQLTGWVASNPEELIGKAVEFVSDPQRLQRLRQGLRAHLLRTPLFDGAAFARDLTEALEQMAG